MTRPTQSPHGRGARLRIRDRVRRSFVRIHRYVATVGLLHGLRLYALETLGTRRVVAVEVCGQRFLLRLNSTDILVVYSVFIREDYRISPLRQPDVIVDAGAYTGFTAMYFAARFPHARILALEPEAGNFELLRRHTAGISRVTAINKALWSTCTELPVRDRGMGDWGYSVLSDGPSEGETATVQTTTIGAIMEQFAIGRIGLLKMDIEGAEREVLDASRAWIENVETIAIELHDRLEEGCSESFASATRDFPFQRCTGMTVFKSRGEFR